MGFLFFITIVSAHILCASWDKKNSLFVAAVEKQRFLKKIYNDTERFKSDELVSAIFDNNTKRVKDALSDKKKSNEERVDAFTLAAISGNKEIVDLFVEHKVPVTYPTLRIARHLNHQHIIPLLEQILQKKRIEQDKQDLRKEFANNDLVQAICDDDIERVQYLLCNGTNVNIKLSCNNSDECTPLHIPAFCRNKKMEKLLLSKGAGDIKWGISGSCSVNCMHTLIESDADVNKVVSWGVTPLMYAVFFDDDDHAIWFIKFLLEKGADANAKCDLNVRSMWYNENGSMGMYVSLVGGDTTNGTSVLNWTLKKWHSPEIIKLLLEKGADVGYQIPLVQHLASCSPYAYNVTKLLLDKGASVRDGNPLIVALKILQHMTDLLSDNDNYVKEYVRIIELLVEKGADLNVQYGDSKTARDIAKELNNPEINSLIS